MYHPKIGSVKGILQKMKLNETVCASDCFAGLACSRVSSSNGPIQKIFLNNAMYQFRCVEKDSMQRYDSVYYESSVLEESVVPKNLS